MSTLVVVDMQDYFLSNRPPYQYVIDGCIREVLLAQKRKAHIILVEYSSGSLMHGTIKEIMDAVGSYPKVGVVLKTAPDGGREVVKYIKDNKVDERRIRFTGIYTSACVYETARTTSNMLKGTAFSIVRNATGFGTTPENNTGLDLFPPLGFKII